MSAHFGESLEDYSSVRVLHQMLTRQGAACMAQQCPHEQPEETTQEPIPNTAAYLAQMTTLASYPQVGKKECTSTHDGNGQDSSDIFNYHLWFRSAQNFHMTDGVHMGLCTCLCLCLQYFIIV